MARNWRGNVVLVCAVSELMFTFWHSQLDIAVQHRARSRARHQRHKYSTGQYPLVYTQSAAVNWAGGNSTRVKTMRTVSPELSRRNTYSSVPRMLRQRSLGRGRPSRGSGSKAMTRDDLFCFTSGLALGCSIGLLATPPLTVGWLV